MECLEVETAEALILECLAVGRHALLRVTGSCLYPTVADGERVRLVSSTVQAPRFGDVVLARLPGGLRLHRLVWPLPGCHAAHVRTKADRAGFLDPAIERVALLATVLDVERGASSWPTRSVGRALLSLLGALLARARLALGPRCD